MRSGTDYPGGNTEDDKKGNAAEDIARMVFIFAAEAKSFTEGIDESDEVKLLRLRTRKNEIVIVPGKSLQVYIGHYADKDRQIRSSYSSSYRILARVDNTVSRKPLWR